MLRIHMIPELETHRFLGGRMSRFFNGRMSPGKFNPHPAMGRP
jgi:hypothetical protein